MPKLWEDDLNFLFDYYKMCSGDNVLLKTKNDQQRGPAAQTSQKSCEAEPQVLPSLGLLEEDNSEPPSQQLQATSPRGSEPLSNLDFSHGPRVALESLPFFCTYGQLLAEEELAPEVCRDRGRDQSIREGLFPEDSGPPSGFFPYYRSKEESFPSLALPGSMSPLVPISCEEKARLSLFSVVHRTNSAHRT
ncbi:hypothetical protein CB1_000686004 [Camelus ferus]|nr:hypothetical protein CB1_000686004 [Camelus ferus]